MDFSELVTKREIVCHTFNLEDGDLGVLSEVLEKTKVLESLNLSCNRLTLEDGSFTSALSRNATLKELYLNHNKIGPGGARRLGAALRSNKTLEKLSLDGNQLGDSCAGHISHLLAENATLEHLSLSANAIGDQGAGHLASALKENKGLGTLSIKGSRIGPTGAKQLADALKENTTIYALHVGTAKDPTQGSVEKILSDPMRKMKVMEALLKRKDAKLRAKDELIAAKSEEMAKGVAEKDAEITRRGRVIADMSKEVEKKDQKMRELEDRLATLQTHLQGGPGADDVPVEDEGCFTAKDVDCHTGDLSIESNSSVTHVSHERWAKEGLAVVVVGASGDLAKKKTYPSLLSLYAGGLLPADLAVYGFARSNMSDEDLRDRLRPYLAEKNEAHIVEDFLGRCFYQSGGGYGDRGAWKELDGKLRAQGGKAGGVLNRLFYFAIPPDVFAETGEAIKANCMAPNGFSRMIVEKPFGRDLESCKHILHQLGQHFDETNLFRIDHYLGKEMTQNLMVMRFGNVWMEHMWNRDHVQCVMLTFKEPFGTDGRGGYFDKYGIIRDIIQNHLLQVMCLLCMEPPNKLDGEGAGEKIRDEKVRVIKAMQEVTLDDVFLGQYAGYSNDPTISNKDTNCPTFAMVRCFINNPRWAGVPIIFKAGKALDERKAEMRVQFKDAPASAALFGTHVPRNEVVVKLQPEESIYMKSNIKTPGFGSAPIQSELEVKYDTRYFGNGTTTNPDAYSRLILDALRGRSANFVRSDELIRAWEIFTPVLHQIEREHIVPHIYRSGTRGPETADSWFKEKSGYVRNEAYEY